MDDDRIDFSALDPSKNSRRWEALVQRTVDQSIVAPAPPSPWTSLIRLRGAVAGFAALALLSWVPALTGDVQTSTDSSSDPVLAFMSYSVTGDTSALVESTNGW